MTRRLPWKRTASGLVGNNANKAAKLAESSHASPSSTGTKSGSRVKKQDPGSDGDDIKPTPRKSPASVANNVTSGIFSDDRASSPPLEPLRETYMVAGIEADDRYRMVEDEFLATAQQFTAHMRAAEYKRLISASRTRNADTIKDISRPVVGRMTDLVRMKAERKARSERIRKELREKKKREKRTEKDGEGGSSDEGEDGDSGEEVYGSTSLLGLMETPNPRKLAPRLETSSSGISRPGMQDLADMDTPVRTSPVAVRKVEAAPRPTFTNIPGLNKKRSADNNRQQQSDRKAVEEEDNETTGSEEDLDKQSRATSFPRTTPRSEMKDNGLSGIPRAAEMPATAGSSSSLVKQPGRKLIPGGMTIQSKSSGSATKESAHKNSGDTDSDDDDEDVLSSLKNRRASAKRRSTGRGAGFGFG